jgi:hypothetical protein
MAISKRTSTVALATLANTASRVGTNFSMENAAVGALVIECVSAITASSVVASFQAQGSVDGTNWYDLAGISADSPAGTGALVTTRLALMVPAQAHAYPLVRVVAALAGGTITLATTAAIYRFVAPGGLVSVAQ